MYSSKDILLTNNDKKKRLDKQWNRLFLGVFIFEFGGVLYEFILNESFLGKAIILLGILTIVYHFIQIPKVNPLRNDKFISTIISIYLIVNIATIVRGLSDSQIGYIITDPKYYWQYTLPFLIFLKLPHKIFSLLYKWSLVYIITAFIFCLYNFNDFYINAAELIKNMIGWEGYILNRPQIPCLLSLPMCLFILNWKVIPTTHKIIICLTITLAILAALFAGRRSVAASVLFFICILLSIKIKKHLLKAIIISTLFYSYLISTSIIQDLSETFSVLSERIDSNTREGVDQDFYKDFKDTSEWILGRGMSGTYRSPSVSSMTGLHRSGIETGYLNIILHGGLLLLLPYIIILLYSSNKFRKKRLLYYNDISCMFYVLFHLIWLYPAGTPKLGLEYFSLWVLISISLHNNITAYFPPNEKFITK